MIDKWPKEREENDNLDEKEEMEDEDGVWNLKENTISKGMVELERMFNNDELGWKRRSPPQIGNDDCDSFNLGLEEDAQMVKIRNAYI